MRYPLSNKPKITQKDIDNKYVIRYFVRFITSNDVVEVDPVQYNIFKKDSFYETIEMKWYIFGTTQDVASKNQKSLDFYSTKMRGITKVIRGPLEYATTTQAPSAEVQQTAQVVGDIINTEATSSVQANATAITVSPTTLTFNYQIDSTVPNSQSLSITADGLLSDLFVTSGSSIVYATLQSTSAPTTVWVTPDITGLYSGSYSTTVIIDSNQSGINSSSVAVTLNVTNNPDILFVYEPGMSLSSATFTRATSASYNELV